MRAKHLHEMKRLYTDMCHCIDSEPTSEIWESNYGTKEQIKYLNEMMKSEYDTLHFHVVGRDNKSFLRGLLN